MNAWLSNVRDTVKVRSRLRDDIFRPTSNRFARQVIIRKYPTRCATLKHYRNVKNAWIEEADALFLYKLVLRSRPLSILELGGGTSTGIMATALHDLREVGAEHQRHIFSLEDDQNWLDDHLQHVPNQLAEYVSFRHSSCIITEVDGGIITTYSEVPQLNYDLIYIDGPDLGRYLATASGDAVELSPLLKSGGSIVFDWRWSSAEYARKHLRGWKTYRSLSTLNWILVKP